MTDKELRRCPFCGGKAMTEVQSGLNHPRIRVICTGCGSSSIFITAGIDRNAKQEAIDLWNHRIVDDRAARPYDAMGDDEGRGETADDWYRENFAEAEAYKGKNDERKF